MTAEETKKLEMHDEVLFGRNGEPGIAHQVKFMWRAHVWLLCALSSVAGFSFKWLIDNFAHKI